MTVRDAAIGDVTAIQDLSRAVGQSGAETGADPSCVALLLATATVKVATDGESGQVAGRGAVRPTSAAFSATRRQQLPHVQRPRPTAS